jgi:hypothetical protein
MVWCPGMRPKKKARVEWFNGEDQRRKQKTKKKQGGLKAKEEKRFRLKMPAST